MPCLPTAGPRVPRAIAHVHHALPAALRTELLALNTPGHDEIHRSHVAAAELSRCYAGAVAALLKASGVQARAVRAIGAHGQTVRHRPDLGYTVQLNAPALLAELSGIDVVADFRSRDVAAGGQGAPLVPAFHRIAFGGDAPRVVVNIGGIGNITVLDGERILGFDAGPGNVLIDGWMSARLGASFDADGALAATATPDEDFIRRAAGRAVLQGGAAEEHGTRSVHARLGPATARRPDAGCEDGPGHADRTDRARHRRCRSCGGRRTSRRC